MGPAGPVGLDYQAIPVVMGRQRPSRRRWAELLVALQVMEVAALEWFAEQRPKH